MASTVPPHPPPYACISFGQMGTMVRSSEAQVLYGNLGREPEAHHGVRHRGGLLVPVQQRHAPKHALGKLRRGRHTFHPRFIDSSASRGVSPPGESSTVVPARPGGFPATDSRRDSWGGGMLRLRWFVEACGGLLSDDGREGSMHATPSELVAALPTLKIPAAWPGAFTVCLLLSVLYVETREIAISCRSSFLW